MKQIAIQSGHSNSVFRTRAWVQAWIDIWGTHPAIQLIDLGGRNDPLEQVYISRQYLKKCFPVKMLSLAGVGCATISTPRAEYIDIKPLVSIAGTTSELARMLGSLEWQRFVIPDILVSSETPQQLQEIAGHMGCIIHQQAPELAYSISPRSWTDYINGLGANTRLAYVNRRKNLLSQGDVQHECWLLHQADSFFTLLNNFHQLRWQRPCFSKESQRFLKNFGERLQDENGQLLFQVLRVSGDIVAVLLDIEWNGTRYNLQSGFYEERFPKIALGALHMGYDIEDAMQHGQAYDFMAGQGKHSNYKARIATHTQSITSCYLERGLLKSLRQFKRRILTIGTPV